MLKTLSLGGGVAYLKYQFDVGVFEDLGYVYDFGIKVDVEEDTDEAYFADASGNLIRMPTTSGDVIKALLGGSFTCQSITRALIQKVMFRGTDSSDGTSLLENNVIAIQALKFISVPKRGPTVCFNAPAIKLTIPKDLLLMNQDKWADITFQYSIVLDEDTNTVPTMRVQEEGESLENFCQ